LLVVAYLLFMYWRLMNQ